MKVLKFGGTSVGSPERMHRVLDLVVDDAPKIVVLSALAGTTDELSAIAEELYKDNKEEAVRRIGHLRKRYDEFMTGLFEKESFLKSAQDMVKRHFDHVEEFSRDMFTLFEERALLAQGELLSTGLFYLLLKERGNNAALLPALEFMRVDKEGEPDRDHISRNLKIHLEGHQGVDLFITQGYICRNEFGEIDNLKRGGSDHTASLIGAALDVEEIQIWTDIDGLHNNDPRVVDDTYPIRELSFDEAAELAYFGAKVLHPSSIRPAKDANIPVRLRNTLDPEATGTIIQADFKEKNIKAIAAKDGIIAVKIKSWRMLMAYGFLKKVFEIFEIFRKPIDMITTSEVAVSLTIDDEDQLEDIVEHLEQFGQVEVDRDQTIICVVGDMLAGRSGYASRIFQALKDVPIRMISYGGSKNNVTFLVNSKDKEQALNALNQGLFKTVGEDV